MLRLKAERPETLGREPGATATHNDSSTDSGVCRCAIERANDQNTAETVVRPVLASPVREIPLTRGLVALVDEADFEMLSHWKWHAHANRPTRFYAYAVIGHFAQVSMHRMVLLPSPGEQVDHVNGDRLDNRRCNLRIASCSQNNANRKPAGRFKGVGPGRWANRWTANIDFNGKRHYLGDFKSPLAAALAYDHAARELHGEFARLNFPEATS